MNLHSNHDRHKQPESKRIDLSVKNLAFAGVTSFDANRLVPANAQS
jgi:hypothetical protein